MRYLLILCLVLAHTNVDARSRTNLFVKGAVVGGVVGGVVGYVVGSSTNSNTNSSNTNETQYSSPRSDNYSVPFRCDSAEFKNTYTLTCTVSSDETEGEVKCLDFDRNSKSTGTLTAAQYAYRNNFKYIHAVCHKAWDSKQYMLVSGGNVQGDVTLIESRDEDTPDKCITKEKKKTTIHCIYRDGKCFLDSNFYVSPEEYAGRYGFTKIYEKCYTNKGMLHMIVSNIRQ